MFFPIRHNRNKYPSIETKCVKYSDNFIPYNSIMCGTTVSKITDFRRKDIKTNRYSDLSSLHVGGLK